jgi:subfamily B ATP-binding cassette protein MsbA
MRDLWALVGPRRGLLLIGLLLMIVGRAASLVLPVSTKFLIDDVFARGRRELLLPIIAGVLAATAVQALSSFGVTHLLSKEAYRLIADLRRKVQAHVGRLPVSFYDGTNSGVLATRIMNDVEGVRHLLGPGLVQFIGGLLTAGVALVLMIRISSSMTAVALLAVIAFFAVLARSFGTLRPIYRAEQRLRSSVTARLYETLTGIRVVKGYHGEEREAGVFAGGVGKILENVLRSLTFSSVMTMASTMLLGVTAGSVMYVAARQILAGQLTVGSFFTYSMLLGFLVGPMFQIVGVGTQLTEAMVGLERTREIMSIPPEDGDPRRTHVLDDIRGEVELEDVHFAYQDGPTVLHGISFRAGPGSVTALVGPSGAGKSTIMGLIAAFQSPASGRLLVDGIDLTTVRLDSFRSRLGIVLQDPFLFSSTIRDNVAFARPDATEQEILTACRIANVDEFAEDLPERYDTIVGERGVKLSGGQRQRVAIARAILADARILILDEATSNLDSESEALIEQGLAHLMSGRTTFVIAHRLSTIRRADHILFIEHGRIVERGTHAALCEAGGRYMAMHTKQCDPNPPLLLAASPM